MPRSISAVPGYNWNDNDLVTASRLNLTATPLVTLEGQDGTDDQADGTITAAKTKFESESALAAVVAALRADGRVPAKDVVTKGPVADVRYFGAVGDGVTDDTAAINLAIAAVLAAGGGTVLFPYGTFELTTYTATVGTISCHLRANGTGTVLFKGIGGGRLRSSATPNPNTGSALLLLQGALVDCAFDDLTFENGKSAAQSYATIGIYLNDNGGTLRNVQVGATCHFRNLSRGIFGGASGVTVNGARFSYPIGRPCSNDADYNVGVWAELTATQVSAEWRITHCQWDGCEATALSGTRPADGLCRGTAMGWTVEGNRVRHVWGTGIEIGLRAIATLAGLSWASSPRPVVVASNTVDFDDVTGETTPRLGRGILVCEPLCSVRGNVVRGAYLPIELLNADYNPADDAGTRMRDFAVTDNVVTLPADLKMSDTYTATANRRGGIAVTGFGAGRISGTVRFLGRTSAGVTAKYWLLAGAQLRYCDEVQTSGLRVSAAVAGVNTDLLWLAGVDLQGCRYCEVGGNFWRNLNIGVNAGTSADQNTPVGNEIGENRNGGLSFPNGTDPEPVVWGFTSADIASQGTLTPPTILKKLSGAGTIGRKQRTSFLTTSTGWIRVATFYKFAHSRVKIWKGVGGGAPLTLETSYVPASGGALVAVAGQPIQTITQARLCTNTSPVDERVHLDLNVGTAFGERIFVEIEGVCALDGVWGEPGAFASMPAGYNQTAAAETLTFGQGLAISGGGWNSGHLILGGEHFWYATTGAHANTLYHKASAPSSDTDGRWFTENP